MFKMFKEQAFGDNMAVSMGNFVEKAAAKKAGLLRAKTFANDFHDNMRMFEQFFTVKPKEGVNGCMDHDLEKTIKLTMDKDFMLGYKCVFVIDLYTSVVKGFEIEKLEVSEE